MPLPRNWKILIALIVLVGVIVLSFVALVRLLPLDGAHMDQELKRLEVALKLYEAIHDGNLPKSLHDLVPRFLYRDDLIYHKGSPQEWLYYYSSKRLEELPSDYILLASPITYRIDSVSPEMRQVLFNGKPIFFIPEVEFQECLTKQTGGRSNR